MKDRDFKIILLLIVPVIILFPGFWNFIYPTGSRFSDLTISHYPNLLFLKQSLIETGQIPLWSDTILSGYPFAANPLSGLWYPFTWLLLLLPQPFGYNLVVIIHLLIGGLGVFRLLRVKGKGSWPALIGGISFQLMPKLMAHYAAGHITLLFAVCISPWLGIVETYRMRRTHSPQFRFLPGILLGWIALADLRWLPYAGIFWLVIHFSVKNEIRENTGTLKRIIASLPGFFLQGFIAACISAPILFPLLQYASLATRDSLETAERLAFSLPPLRVLNLFFPDFGGYHEWVIYSGVFSIFALVIVLSNRFLRRGNWIWIFLVFLSVFIALGVNNPVMVPISTLPGYDLMRVPPRANFLGGMAFCLLAGSVADSILRKKDLGEIKIFPVIVVSLFAVLFFGGYYWQFKTFNVEIFWGAFLGLVFSAYLILIKTSPFLHSRLSKHILISLVLLDLGVVCIAGFQFRSSESVLKEGREIAGWIQQQQEQHSRVYSPSYSIPQLNGVYFQLQLADGIDPLQVATYVEYMNIATGVKSKGYSVTLPAFHSGNPQMDNAGATPDAERLGILNVAYVVSSFPIEAKGLTLVHFDDSTYVYENSYFRPRAWLQESSTGLAQEFEQVEVQSLYPNRIVLKAKGPGVVVLSELWYPGWHVYVDGKRGQVLKVENLLRAVSVDEGVHSIQFIYRPFFVYAGAILFLITCTFLLGYYLLLFIRQRNLKI